MKTAAVKSLRRKLAADLPLLGLWVTLEAPAVTEMAVALGLDWVVIDAEHGHLDWKEIVEHLRATARSDTVALVRIAELNGALIKRALDLGADGVVVPWVETAAQLRQAVAWARYPVEGRRGIGAERATVWGQCILEHTAEANEHVLVVPIIESVAAVAEVPAMCQVEGVELFYFGPADFSSTAGYRGQWEGPGVAEQILAMKEVIRRAGKHCGVVTKSAKDLKQRQEQGFRMLGVGIDAGLLIRSLRAMLASAGRDRALRPDLTVVSEPKPAAPLARPPESMRPDRPEVMTHVGSGPVAEIAPGIRFECLVGAPNHARNLTTGLVTIAPEAVLPYHTHPFTEAITLLHGQAFVEVEGRCYELGRHDNVVIPRGTAHSTRNPSPHQPTVIHIAMATDKPTRTLVHEPFPRQVMPASSTGRPGGERVNRFQSAPRFAAGPNTEFIDFFNNDLVPGIEMSGGFGLFHRGGRLPAHVHDFDESICIIQATAVCIVEGRRYSLDGCATAMVPRGRVHYFVNEADAPMAMVWVYAGPMPERIVVDERCATVEGNPWKQ
jgi:2-keto-3-deoxy-L-rhamnonate aldolase RhmA/quercetin dioxygenase-like cupin family protein